MNIITMPVGMLGTNCYILSSKANSCAIIDPGAQPEKIIARVAEEKLTVRYILLTHGHHDHIGGVKRLCGEFSEAKLFVGKNDLEMLTDGRKSLAAIRHPGADEFIVDRAEALADGQELELDEMKIRVVESPGHSKGSVCYLCRDAMFSGDTLFFGDVGRCDLYGGDYDAMKASLRKLIELEGDYRVYPGHGNGSSLEYERMHNPYIAEARNDA